MNNDEPVDGVYWVKERIGEGGMAEIYRVEVDLDAFDYSMLFAYTQADGETHAQRQAQARELNRKLEKKDLDPNTVRAILEAQRMPVPGKVAALKLAKPGADRGRFDAEWQYLMCLHHPNLIDVYGGGIWRGHPYYVMEHLTDTVPMKETLATTSLLEKLELMRQVGESLAYLVYLNGRVGELSSMTDEKLSRLSTLGKRLKDHVDAMRTSRTAWRQAMGINSGDPTCRS